MSYAASRCARSTILRRLSMALICLSICALCATSSFGQTSHSVSLSWTASTDFAAGDSYNVYRGSVSGGPYSKLNTAPITTTTFTDTTVVAGSTYFYVATHVSGTAESVDSNEAKAVVLPRAPSALVATPN